MRRLFVLSAMIAAWLLVATTPAAAQEQDPAPPAEEIRLDGNVFRHGLKRRGLDELLELHLKDFPPRDPGSRLLMERDIKLGRFADPSLPRAERMAALAEANAMLARIIELRPDDSDRFEWMLALGRSLVTEEAEPHYAAILYHGGAAQNRLRLGELSARAIEVLERARTEIAAEFERMDALTSAQFESLEKSGFVDKLDRMAPEVDYRLLWAWFQDAISRSPDDPARAERLGRVREMLAANPGLTDVPHELSRIQAHAVLLRGMVLRRLDDRRAARESLDLAMSIVDAIPDPTTQTAAAWVADIALIERVRTELDAGLLDEAQALITRFASRSATRAQQGFPLRLVAALLEREVMLRRSAGAAAANERLDAARFRVAAWQPLARLARREPDHRDEIYALLVEKIGLDADPAALDPLQRCALIAGLLSASSGAEDQARQGELLRRAVEIGRSLLDNAGEAEADLVPEVLFNVAVAYQRQGRLQQAADSFLRVARERPDCDRAAQSAALAVQLAFRLHEARPADDAARRVYFEALQTLVLRYEPTEDAKYWRFFYARLLDDLGRHDEAARQFAAIEPGHDHELDAVHARFQSLGLLLAGRGSTPRSTVEQQRLVAEFLDAQRAVVSRLAPAAEREPDPARKQALERYLASAAVIFAEGHTTEMLQRPEKALEILADFEQRFGKAPGLIGRVYRTRMAALERLGRADEAVALIPAFIENDPENAGGTLQTLYDAAVAEWTTLYEADRDEEAAAKAEAALRIAEQILAWAADPRFAARVTNPGAIRLQAAEARLRAGKIDAALAAFAERLGVAPPAADLPPDADLRAAWGYAESLYRGGNHAAALPLFNRIFLGTPATEPLHFRALLRDLQSRLELGQPPADVLRVIQQHETLHPAIGPTGESRTAREIQALKREVQRRAGR